MSTLGFCNLSISYGGVVAVNGFNDILHAGEWLCLIGPNGAGKSSVLRAAAGLVEYSGSVAIDQLEIPATSAKWRAQIIAFVPQTPLIPDDLSVFDFVCVGRNAVIQHFACVSTDAWEVIVIVLTRLDLARFAIRMVGTLS
ncbi:MAG: ATP-binding cassette domain-containing protein, partial [Actinomycetota bacterium]